MAILKCGGALALTLLLLSSCQRCPLDARLEALTPRYLASSHVNTPDPLRCNFCGQQLVVTWQLPCLYEDLSLTLSLITSKHQFKTIHIPISGSVGSITYQILNEHYQTFGSILTYKVELFGNGRLLATYRPRTWVDWIYIE